jgi:YggT family protein
VLGALCDPVLRPIRRILPVVGGLDFSPLVAILGLTALRILLR